MKKFFLMLAAAAMLAAACDPAEPAIKTFDVTVSLEKDAVAYEVADITVNVRNLNDGSTFDAKTDETGTAKFLLLAGLYEASCSFKNASEGEMFTYNAVNSNVSVTEGGETAFKLNLVESKASQIIVKELYTGGCKKEDGKTFQHDSYIILYNNSDMPADASNICFAFTMPMNSNGASDWRVDGKLSYEDSYIPAGYGLWWFDSQVIIEPYKQIVVATRGAVNHTATYANSVDLSNAEYYAMYDPESGYVNALYYPAPSEAIPTSHYLKAYSYGTGNAWPMSVGSSAFFIFNMDDAKTFAQTEANLDYTMKTSSVLGPCVKIPLENVVDAVEVFAIGKEDKNAKRFPASVDAGYIYYTTGEGYTAYRNVDKEATEAIEGNKDKLVYGYSLGTESIDQTTDPSGIDAEASIANGAIIIYKDTNNSTNDFHLRSRASLKK